MFSDFNSLLLALFCLHLACQETEHTISQTTADYIDQGVSDLSTLDVDLAVDLGRDAELDQTLSSIEEDMSFSTPPRIEFCNDLSLTSKPWLNPDEEYQFGSIAGDFTVQTISGAWNLIENWSGCESFIFLVYFPDLRSNQTGVWVGDQLWESDVSMLLNGPENTHYFFISYEDDPQARSDRMINMHNRFIRSLNVGEELPTSRLHFVTDRATEIEGSVGEFFNTYLEFLFDPSSVVDLGDRGSAQAPLPFVFGIDRMQRWDSGGSLDEVVGQPMLWKMASYIAPFYNYISDTYERAENDRALEINLVDERLSERVFLKTVELPSQDKMEEYNTLEIDVSVTCPHQNVYACSEWDRIARISYCTDSECEQSFEIARWITPYWRRGERRWIWDASPFIALLASGGNQSFRIELGPSWERATERDVKISLRLNTVSPSAKATATELAFKGGEFNETYNDRSSFSFNPPSDVDRVELVALISGHGQSAQDNCAEWCDHQHHFTLNGTALPTIQHEGMIGSVDGCAEASKQGVSPGQFGNWAPERAYWCPGLPVNLIRIDLSDYVMSGSENILEYRSTLGSDLDPRGGNVALSTYVVYYTP